MSIPGNFTDVNKITEAESLWLSRTGAVVSKTLQNRVVFKHTRQGSNTPRFSTIEPSKLPVNFASMVYETRMPWWGTITNVSGDGRTYTGGYAASSGIISVPDIATPVITTAELTAMANMLDARLLSKIKDQKVNIAIALAERLKTTDMLLNTAFRFINAFRALRKGDFKTAAAAFGVLPRKRGMKRFNRKYLTDRTNAVTSGWLELQYGWKPLMMDVYGSVAQVADAVNRLRTTKVRSRASREIYETKTQRIGSSKYTSRGFQTVTMKKMIRFRVDPGSIRDLAQVGITNPALVAWEVIPYSFVFDWLWPIGKYLENIDATFGCIFEVGSSTIFKESQSTYVLEVTGWRGQLQASFDGKSFSRTVLTAWPVNRLPPFKNPVSISHSLSAFSLLWKKREWLTPPKRK